MTAIPPDDATRKLDRALVEDPARGIYLCNREIFTDPGLARSRTVGGTHA